MKRILALCILAAIMNYGPTALAVPQQITYQGFLTNPDGTPLDSTVSIAFTIYDAASNGTIQWTETHPSVAVTDGGFEVSLGSITALPDVFADSRWLGIRIGADAEMSPRQQIVSVAHAYRVGTVDGASGGTISGKLNVGENNSNPGSFANVSGQNSSAVGDYSVVGGGLSNWASGSHSTVSGGSANLATGAGSTVSGGLNNNAVNSYGTVSGGMYNFVHGQYSVIAGGGGAALSDSNSATGDYSAIGGGRSNTANGTSGVVSGGNMNRANNNYDAVVGGERNYAGGSYAFVGGGLQDTARNITDAVCGGWMNTASGGSSFVGGGKQNTATAAYAAVGGGTLNDATGSSTTVGGGYNNLASGAYATVCGGRLNNARGTYSVIAGGGGAIFADSNSASGDASTVCGGRSNAAKADYSTIGGGVHNYARGLYSVVTGGGSPTLADSNAAIGNYSSILGGYHNAATGDAATIAGGYYHTASGGSATVSGGYRNTATNSYSSVGGGTYNEATGQYAAVPGGSHNVAAGNYSFAAGRRAKANASGTFVWADGTNADFNWPDPPDSVLPNSFAVRASGGVNFFTNAGLTSGVRLVSGGSAWQTLSDSTKKQNIRLVDTKIVLDRVAQLPIKQWSYKSQDPSIEHIGPMAQDFWSLFHIGDDSLSISTIDPSGIALAAIQELVKRNQALEARVSQLEQQLAAKAKE